ncbi:tetratricopeptide repeat protein [Undibacterium sp. JH2W]|uniref:tetratricopeptide repeat protein n=1 Tax=Undibacterium sp. JH2W TaxID=3413037 RepID=UPI003BF1AB3E
MKKRTLYSLLVLLAFGISSQVQAASSAKNNQEAQLDGSPVCTPVPVSKCWKRLADYLEKAKPPENEREFGDQLFSYIMMAKLAYWAKDFADAKEINQLALEFSKKRKFTGRDADMSASLFGVMININLANLALSKHEYAEALNYLDQYSSIWEKLGEQGGEPGELVLMRCAALIGMQRGSEAEVLLEQLLKKLNFSGQAPWEANPIGLEPVNPYEAGRRIAAHFMREGKYDKVLALLQSMEQRRTQTISQMSKDPVAGGYWAIHGEPTALLDDLAAIYLKLGRDAEAEPLLRASLLVQEKNAGKRLPLLLTRLAELSRRKGQLAEADALMLRAKAIPRQEQWERIDPLAQTLGYID